MEPDDLILPSFVRVSGGGSFAPGRDLETTLPPMVREAELSPASFNDDELTVELRWSTGARVLRVPFFDDPFFEELSLEPGEVRLERLNEGAPLLDSHRRGPLEAQIGRIVPGTAVVRDGVAVATVRLSRRSALEDLRQDIRDGIVGNVSVGYTIYQFRDVTTKDDRYTVLRAIDWEPHELSFVAVPAESGMGTRGQGSAGHSTPCVIRGATTLLRPRAMEPEEDPTTEQTTRAAEGGTPQGSEATPPAPPTSGERSGAPEAPAEAPAPEAAPAPTGERGAEELSGVEAERQRAHTIRTIVRQQSLPESLADELVASGASVDAARARVLDTLADRSAAGIQSNHATTTTTRSAQEKAHGAVLSAMRNRFGLREVTTERDVHGAVRFIVADSTWGLTDEARDLEFASGIDMARVLLEADGVSVQGLSRDHISRLAFGSDVQFRGRSLVGTSAFPNLFANVQHNALLMSYAVAPRTFMVIARQRNAQDFKTMTRTKLSGAPALEKVAEAGEIKRGTMVEEAETYKLGTFGKIMGFTRQALVNDALQGLMDLAEKFGAAAALVESETVWAIFNDNVVLGDGTALFDAAHNNVITTSSPISVDNLGAARTLLRRQTDPLGKRMNLNVFALVVPAELETKAQQHTAAIDPEQAGNANPFASAFQAVIAESHLTNTQQWYVTANPAVQPTIEWAYLEGAPGPQVSTRAGWDIDGMETKVTLDFAAAAMDHRGLVRAAG